MADSVAVATRDDRCRRDEYGCEVVSGLPSLVTVAASLSKTVQRLEGGSSASQSKKRRITDAADQSVLQIGLLALKTSNSGSADAGTKRCSSPGPASDVQQSASCCSRLDVESKQTTLSSWFKSLRKDRIIPNILTTIDWR
jgi:hypothetical protein